MEPSDAELLRAWWDGDRASGEALIRRHYRTVLRFFELNAGWAADDLVQRTFMACVENPRQVRDADAFRAFLLGVARRQLAMYLREVARDRTLASFDPPEPRGRPTRLSTLVARGREQLLALRALASLPRGPQTLLVLYYWDGVRTPELSTSYQVPQSTIRTRLGRARDLLRDKMARLSHPLPLAQPDAEQLHRLIASLVAPEEEAAG
ncbi:MAG: sigma-70 family RNA polymerase sigma factor [Myxococcota bacterium]